MSSSSSPSVWSCPPESLADQVCETVVAALNDTSDTLAQTMHTLTSVPSTDAAHQFFQSINPLLTQNLSNLRAYALRNVFSLPPNLDPHQIHTAVESLRQSNADPSELDHQIATLRARIKQADDVIARLTVSQKTAERQTTALRDIAPESVAPQQFHSLLADIKAAENDFVTVTNILKEHRTNSPSDNPLLHAAATVVSKGPTLSNSLDRLDENGHTLFPSEEHEPLNHMPTAQSILGISMGADPDRLQDLDTLRARLLG